MISPKVSLSVNDFDIPIVEFVQVFINSVVTAMLSVLKGVGEIRSADLSIYGDDVVIKVNNTAIPSNDFVNIFVRNTVTGMVTSLKGVDQVNKLEINITS